MPDSSRDLSRPAALAAALARLQDLLLDTADVTDFLQQASAVASAMMGDISCGITIRRDQQVETIAKSDGFAAEIDEIQYGRGQGPCLESLHTGALVRVDDLAVDDRWSDYRVHALAHGVRSSLSVPLALGGRIRGALNLYATTPHRFSSDDIAHGEAFGRQVATALGIMLRHADQAVLLDQLREALSARSVIDQAIGIVMGQLHVAADRAFEVLREASQTRNRKLTEVAATLVESITGRPPIPPRPFTDPR